MTLRVSSFVMTVGRYCGFFGPYGVDGFIHRFFENFPVEEEQGVEGLVLRRCGDIFIHCEMREEGLDFRTAHLFRITVMLKRQVAGHPREIALFGPNRVVLQAD